VPIGGDQILTRGLTRGEGEVGEKVQELTAVTGVAGVGEERDQGGGSTVNRGGRRGPRDGDGVPVAGGQEGGGKVARKLPRDDVVPMVCLSGAKRRRSAGTTARPSGGGSSSSPAQWSGQSSAEERNWAGL
jgi:hypothetical protein